jgi:hypothetical protein
MASSHVAGQQKRALTRYTLFVVWELSKMPLARHSTNRVLLIPRNVPSRHFSLKSYDAEPIHNAEESMSFTCAKPVELIM